MLVTFTLQTKFVDSNSLTVNSHFSSDSQRDCRSFKDGVRIPVCLNHFAASCSACLPLIWEKLDRLQLVSQFPFIFYCMKHLLFQMECAERTYT